MNKFSIVCLISLVTALVVYLTGIFLLVRLSSLPLTAIAPICAIGTVVLVVPFMCLLVVWVAA